MTDTIKRDGRVERGLVALYLIDAFDGGKIRSDVTDHPKYQTMRHQVCEQLIARGYLVVTEEPGDLSPALDIIETTDEGWRAAEAVRQQTFREMAIQEQREFEMDHRRHRGRLAYHTLLAD